MDLSYRYKNEALIIDITNPEGGFVADGDVDGFVGSVKELITPQVKMVALDMSKKIYLNSTGLGELIKFKDILMDSSIGLTLIKPGDKVESLINMVGIDRFFTILSNEDELG